jgi:hypothetical protein
MLVENTEARILSLPSGESLVPGMNDVPTAVWAKACAHPVISAMVAAGMLKAAAELTQKAAPADTPIDSLAGLSGHEAESLAEKTYDRDLLKKWLATEKRSKVRKALDAQLETLKVSAPEE